MVMNENELITDFVNTLHKDPELEADEEQLTTPAELVAWLDAHGLSAGSRATRVDLARAIDLREALRVLLLANNGEEVDAAAANAVLDRTARAARVELRFADGAPTLASAAAGVSGALGGTITAAPRQIDPETRLRVQALPS